MELLYKLSNRLISETKFTFRRYLYDKIDWDDRLIIIKGPKGVGKTTLLLQHIKEAFKGDYGKVIFASLDHVWFGNHSILDLAEYHYSHGGTHMFLDEIHKYPNWEQEIKNIYDFYRNMHIVATGSSMLRIDASSIADLSRRHSSYQMQGLSFREYLNMGNYTDLKPLTLDEILSNHLEICMEITSEIKVLPLFEEYLKRGYYPFERESKGMFYDKLRQAIVSVIESDIPLVGQINYESVYKLKQLLSILAQETPYTINQKSLSLNLGVSRNTLVKLIDLLDRAMIVRKLFSDNSGLNSLQKPEKLLFNDTNIMYSLSSWADLGTIRETFAASQLSESHRIAVPLSGDLLVDNKITFEIGGKNKKFKQIKDLPESFVLSDTTDIGFGNKIPLWLIGLLY